MIIMGCFWQLVISCEEHWLIGSIENGELLGFGSGGQGQIGNGTRKNQFHPVLVADLSNKILSFSCGNSHCIALAEDNVVYMWGYIRYASSIRVSYAFCVILHGDMRLIES
jgi:alpha-tubulin suppressor-like RCC1 family protein